MWPFLELLVFCTKHQGEAASYLSEWLPSMRSWKHQTLNIWVYSDFQIQSNSLILYLWCSSEYISVLLAKAFQWQWLVRFISFFFPNMGSFENRRFPQFVPSEKKNKNGTATFWYKCVMRNDVQQCCLLFTLISFDYLKNLILLPTYQPDLSMSATNVCKGFFCHRHHQQGFRSKPLAKSPRSKTIGS